MKSNNMLARDHRTIRAGKFMDTQVLLNALFGLAGMLGGAVLRATWAALEKMREDLGALQKSIGETYVRRDDFRDHAMRVEATLERIEAKLDMKADKL